jgi:hypothetical protein
MMQTLPKKLSGGSFIILFKSDLLSTTWIKTNLCQAGVFMWKISNHDVFKRFLKSHIELWSIEWKPYLETLFKKNITIKNIVESINSNQKKCKLQKMNLFYYDESPFTYKELYNYHWFMIHNYTYLMNY